MRQMSWKASISRSASVLPCFRASVGEVGSRQVTGVLQQAQGSEEMADGDGEDGYVGHPAPPGQRRQPVVHGCEEGSQPHGDKRCDAEAEGRLRRHDGDRGPSGVAIRDQPRAHRVPGLPIGLRPPRPGCPAGHRRAGYLVDSVGGIFSDRYSLNVSSVTLIGEAPLLVWLLVKGRRIRLHV